MFEPNTILVVQFNVGGQIFATLKSTINKPVYKNLLQDLIRGADTIYYQNNAIFIDQDPKHFQSILNYLRSLNSDDKKFDLPESDVELRSLLREAAYFQIQGLLDLAEKLYPFDTNILTMKQSRDLIALCEFEFYGKWRLMYRGSRDGFGGSNFHSKCDGIPKSLTIIKSTNGNLFGCVIRLVLDNLSRRFAYDNTCFLFSLVNKENTPLKLNIIQGMD
jgi:hypothetical protein